jgi:hypothetical protein
VFELNRRFGISLKAEKALAKIWLKLFAGIAGQQSKAMSDRKRISAFHPDGRSLIREFPELLQKAHSNSS